MTGVHVKQNADVKTRRVNDVYSLQTTMPPVSPLTLVALLSCSALIQSTVFLDQSSAGQILGSAPRRRRANALFMEELLPGDLERECYEERCSQEEAAEIFQTREKTLEFWFKYTNLNACRINPCLNGGMCLMDRGAFTCVCPPQYQGKTCASVLLECRYRNGGCVQYCRDLPGGAGVQCGCADGFQLDPDGRSCSQTTPFPCGLQQRALLSRARSLGPASELENVTADGWPPALNLTGTDDHPTEANATSEPRANETQPRGEDGGWEEDLEPRVVGGSLERQGGSPWQVLVRRADGYGFCGGTLVSDQWVVSAAHCFQETADHVTIGDWDKRRPDPGEQVIPVQQVFVHPHFHSFTFDSDLALLFLARPVVRGPTAAPACLPDPHLSKYLLQDGNRGQVTGWGVTHYLGRSSRFLRKVALPVVSFRHCTASTEQVITDNMFCAGYLDASMDACSGDSGGPFVVNYRGTWFLTGVVSWGEKCAAKGKYGVYTRLGNFLSWIRDTMDRTDLNGTES
ncbi:coagulation factor X [Antennarius striatus]|uniref:coagulation factor X n=1 Tax=Antennarius striatus TaxID=241820 RepID=UPI0035B0E2E6